MQNAEANRNSGCRPMYIRAAAGFSTYRIIFESIFKDFKLVVYLGCNIIVINYKDCFE